MIELYDFDRCTGISSNPINVESPSTGPFPVYWSCECISPSGRYLYVSSQMSTVNNLWQYDTWASNIFTTKTLIWQSFSPPSYILANLKRGPDEKIYVSCGIVHNGTSIFLMIIHELFGKHEFECHKLS